MLYNNSMIIADSDSLKCFIRGSDLFVISLLRIPAKEIGLKVPSVLPFSQWYTQLVYSLWRQITRFRKYYGAPAPAYRGLIITIFFSQCVPIFRSLRWSRTPDASFSRYWCSLVVRNWLLTCLPHTHTHILFVLPSLCCCFAVSLSSVSFLFFFFLLLLVLLPRSASWELDSATHRVGSALRQIVRRWACLIGRDNASRWYPSSSIVSGVVRVRRAIKCPHIRYGITRLGRVTPFAYSSARIGAVWTEQIDIRSSRRF